MKAFFICCLFVLCAYSFYGAQGCGSSTSYSGWDTQFEKSFKLECKSGQSFYDLQSLHSNKEEDRVWSHDCRDNPYIKTSCNWVVPFGQYVNNYDKVVNFVCPRKGYMVAMYGDQQHKYYNDRRFNFKCCDAKAGHGQVNCRWTSFVNDFDGRMHFTAPSGYYFAGAYSIHRDYTEDRRWQFYICR